MFADYLALRISSETKLTTKLSKIDNSFRYKAILDPRHNPTKIGLSQARRRTPTPTPGSVRFRGIHNIRDSLRSSNKISKIFWSNARSYSDLDLSRRHFINSQLSIIAFLMRFLNHIPYVERGWTVSINLFDHAGFDPANLFRGLPRANVIFSDKEHYVLNKLERVIHH